MPARRARLNAALLALLLGLDLFLANWLSPNPNIGLPLAGLALLPVLLLAANAAHAHTGLRGMWLVLLAGALFAALSLPWLSHHIATLYLVQHVGVNAALGLWFALSLRSGHEPLVTRFARPLHTHLSPALRRYTRQVTVAWSLFFLLMTVSSLGLFLCAPRAIWSLFANAATLPLVLLMFAGEFLMRRWALPPEDRLDPLSALRAYRQASRPVHKPAP